jgi:hypothetical protein
VPDHDAATDLNDFRRPRRVDGSEGSLAAANTRQNGPVPGASGRVPAAQRTDHSARASAYEGIEALDPAAVTDIDKPWDGLRFLLVADGAPVDVINGGAPFADEEWGYDIPRYLTAEEVQRAAAYLSSTPWQTIAQHFDRAAMDREEIYPGGWTESELGYLGGHYSQLVDFFGMAAQAQQVVILWKS